MFYDLTYGSEIEDTITFSPLGQNITNVQLDVLDNEALYLRMSRLDFAFVRI